MDRDWKRPAEDRRPAARDAVTGDAGHAAHPAAPGSEEADAAGALERARREASVFGANPEDMEALYRWSRAWAQENPSALQDLATYCCFIGYPRSGHSLVGSLLDAHPAVIIAHELDALKFIEAGFQDRQIYALILQNSALFARFGRRWGRYSYAVPGQWQGRYARLEVIGDKKGGRSTIRFARNPHLLGQLDAAIGLRKKFVHVVRNPFDNIARIAIRQTRDLRLAVNQYFGMCRSNQLIKERVGRENLIEMHHEALIADPPGELTRLAAFLDVEAEPGWIRGCSEVVFEAPRKSRRAISWPREAVECVEREMQRHDFLGRYSFVD